MLKYVFIGRRYDNTTVAMGSLSGKKSICWGFSLLPQTGPKMFTGHKFNIIKILDDYSCCSTFYICQSLDIELFVPFDLQYKLSFTSDRLHLIQVKNIWTN